MQRMLRSAAKKAVPYLLDDSESDGGNDERTVNNDRASASVSASAAAAASSSASATWHNFDAIGIDIVNDVDVPGIGTISDDNDDDDDDYDDDDERSNVVVWGESQQQQQRNNTVAAVAAAVSATANGQQRASSLSSESASRWTTFSPSAAPVAAAAAGAAANPAALPLFGAQRQGSQSESASERGADARRAASGAARTMFSPRRRAEFVPERAGLMQRAFRPPYVRPAGNVETLRDVISWKRRQVDDMLRLHEQPWYRFVELVAGKSGMRLDAFVHIQNEQAPQPAVVAATDGLFGGGGGGDEDEELDAAAEDSATNRREYLEAELSLELAAPSSVSVPVPNTGATARERRDAARAAGWMSASRVTGVVFFSPLYTSCVEEALQRVRTSSRLLAAAPLGALTTDPAVRIWFAVVVASLANSNAFVGGLNPLRATDYAKYVDRLDEAMARLMRYAWDGRAFVSVPRKYWAEGGGAGGRSPGDWRALRQEQSLRAGPLRGNGSSNTQRIGLSKYGGGFLL